MNNIGALPCALLVDFRPIIWTYTPSTTPTPHLFENTVYQNGTMLRDFIEIHGMKSIIEALFGVSRNPDDGHNSFWDAMEVRFPNGLGEIESDMKHLEALALLSEILIESVDVLMADVSKKLNFRPDEQYLYFFDHWLTDTVAVLTHENYETK